MKAFTLWAFPPLMFVGPYNEYAAIQGMAVMFYINTHPVTARHSLVIDLGSGTRIYHPS